ncbi:MAG: hypothetical protein E7171_08515 [Firmicutes bacterium]|nr:hypothetical protein [Bacillota bacterium]
MKRRKNKKTTLILVLVLLISVGYAALASNLKINGSSKVNAAKWNVYWDNIQITEGSVPADNDHKARITDSGKTQVEFSIVLNVPGDYYEFTVDAVNNGTIDAMIAANGIVDGVYSDSNYTQTATLPDAVSYTVTYADGTVIEPKHLLAKKSGNTATRETYKVRIEYRNDDEIDADDLDENDQTYYFKFSVNYVQADNTAIFSHPSAIHYVNRQVPGQITPGDTIKIGDTEDFYVVSSTPEKTVLIAKYNLFVGSIFNSNTGTLQGRIQPTDSGYGLQSAAATAYGITDDSGIMKGGVPFSNTNYWMSNDNLLSAYNQNNTIYYDLNVYRFKHSSDNSFASPYVYDNTYATAPDFSSECQYDEGGYGINNCWNTPGYSIAYYVEQYKARLIEMGAPSTITGRLLSYEEADAVKSIPANTGIEDASIVFDGFQAYWLGSAYRGYVMYYVDGSNFYYFNAESYDNNTSCGVRPVIEVPTNKIR